MVLGADQMLELADGTQLDKPADADEARAHLAAMSGTTHRLLTAAVIVEDGAPVWRHVEVVKLAMRTLSDAFIDAYVARHWQDIRHSVGCYRIEREGAQLFQRIDGSHFAIIGLPLLPLLDYLRVRGKLPS
jgi:septum formation protein